MGVAQIVIILLSLVVLAFVVDKILTHLENTEKCENCFFSCNRYDKVLDKQGRCWCMRYYISKPKEGYCNEWREKENV